MNRSYYLGKGWGRDGEKLSKQTNSICRDPKAEGTEHLESQRAEQHTANRPVAGDERESTEGKDSGLYAQGTDMLRPALYDHPTCSVEKLLCRRPDGKWRPTRGRETDESERAHAVGGGSK